MTTNINTTEYVTLRSTDDQSQSTGKNKRQQFLQNISSLDMAHITSEKSIEQLKLRINRVMLQILLPPYTSSSSEPSEEIWPISVQDLTQLKKIDHDYFSLSTEEALSKILSPEDSEKQITLESNASPGVSQSWFVSIDKKKQKFLKQVELPSTCYAHKDFQLVRNSTEEKIEDFLKNPKGLGHDFPVLQMAQREKLGPIVGQMFGVPKVETVRTKEGLFTLHEYIEPHAQFGTLYKLSKSKTKDTAIKKLSLESIQTSAVLHLILEDSDPNKGNILIIPKDEDALDCIPIDLALTFAQENFGSFSKSSDPLLKLPQSSEPLTEKAKNLINALNSGDLLKKAEKEGLHIDERVKTRLPQNIGFIKEMLKDNLEITLKELAQAFNNFKLHQKEGSSDSEAV